MNRRDILSGGLFGMIGALFNCQAHIEEPPNCQNGHEPDEKWHMPVPAFQLITGDGDYRILCPCKRCGVMLGLKRKAITNV